MPVPVSGPEVGTPAPGAMEPEQAAEVVWLDALVMNVDRTPRNPNLLSWHGRTWLIDHGASLYLQHDAAVGAREAADRGFAHIAQHALLPLASSVEEADARLAPRLDEAALERVAGAIPGAWLGDRRREDLVEFLARRLAAPRTFAQEAEHARRRV